MDFLNQLLPNLTPILLTATGVLFTELAGVLNIGAEGMMVWGAFFSLSVMILTGNPYLALLAAGVAGGVAAALVATMHIKFKANVFIVGLAINLFAWGLTPILGSLLFGIRGVISLQQLGVDTSGLAGALLFLQGLGFVVLIITMVIFRKTRAGAVYIAIHDDSQAVELLGIKLSGYKISALITSGILAGLAGAVLAFRLGSYVPNISAGRGWISLVVVFLGNLTPLGILGAAIVFTAAELLATQAQEGFGLPGLLIGLPYLLTFSALVIWTIIKKVSVKKKC